MQCCPFISHMMSGCQLLSLPSPLSFPPIFPPYCLSFSLPLCLSSSHVFCSSVIPQGDFPSFTDTAAVPRFVLEGLSVDQR